MRQPHHRVLVLTTLVFATLAFTSWGQQREDSAEDLERKLAQVRREMAVLRQKYREQMQERLGDRHKLLMEFSIDELSFALDTKLRDTFEGAAIFSSEDEPVFLGMIADKFDPDSIFNSFGPYGSSFGARSIWNNLGRYGGTLSLHSPFNGLSNRPPFIVKDRKVIGRLTVSRFVQNRVDPSLLKMTFEGF